LVPAPALPPPPGLDGCVAVVAYIDGGRELLARLKYHNARASVQWLAWQLAEQVRATGADGRASVPARGRFDVVTWAPTSDARRQKRGFDQAHLLARSVARRLGLPCAPLLRRLPGDPQTGRTSSERWAGPKFTVARAAPVPARVLLVDDVITTGATLSAAARALREGGAAVVWGGAGARTPLKARSQVSDASINGHEPTDANFAPPPRAGAAGTMGAG
jgi:ComF family protein